MKISINQLNQAAINFIQKKDTEITMQVRMPEFPRCFFNLYRNEEQKTLRIRFYYDFHYQKTKGSVPLGDLMSVSLDEKLEKFGWQLIGNCLFDIEQLKENYKSFKQLSLSEKEKYILNRKRNEIYIAKKANSETLPNPDPAPVPEPEPVPEKVQPEQKVPIQKAEPEPVGNDCTNADGRKVQIRNLNNELALVRLRIKEMELSERIRELEND